MRLKLDLLTIRTFTILTITICTWQQNASSDTITNQSLKGEKMSAFLLFILVVAMANS